MTLDFPGGGYRLGSQTELTPFTRREDCITGPTLPTHFTAAPAFLPAGINAALQKCPANNLQKIKLEDVLRPFSPMFTERPGKTDILLHRIETGDAPPWRCNPRPISVHKRELLDKALEEMIDTGATDASDIGVGAVLLQEHDCVLRPVAFASQTLTPAQRNYSVAERECLAIVYALKRFDMYLDGATFQIQCDHLALSWLKRLQNPAGRLARWALMLQRYDYTIVYRPGATNKIADALSRAPLPEEHTQERPGLVAVAITTQESPESRWGALITREELLKAQQDDGLCQRVTASLAITSTVNGASDEQFDSYLLSSDGLLLRYIPQADDDPSSSAFRTVIPRKLPTRSLQTTSASASRTTSEKLGRASTSPDCSSPSSTTRDAETCSLRWETSCSGALIP
ncbi:uncharacterized protein ISCGN_012674 [Ixodes scapularis]